jgi:hypothetical protein
MGQTIKTPAGDRSTPERRFANNMRYLLESFKDGFKSSEFSQNDLAVNYLHIDAAVLSKFKNGAVSALSVTEKQDQYYVTAEYMLMKICRSREKTDKLFAAAGLKQDDGFDYAELSSDGDLRKRVGEKIKQAMFDEVFPVSGSETARDETPPPTDGKETKIPTDGNENEPIPHNPTDGNVTRKVRFAAKYKVPLIVVAAILLCAVAVTCCYTFFIKPNVALDITYYAPIGESGPIVTGTVTVVRGNPDDYAVTMAVVSPADGRVYAPKPNISFPSVPVTTTDKRGVGNFTCVFAVGDSPDSRAEVLYVYVIPADFVPDEDADRTKRNSVAFAEINRDAD